MYFLGQTINVFTLGGLALAVGRLVDDSIVELENINRHLAMPGKDRRTAVLDAAREVAMPIFVSTITTIVVFLPTLFIEGQSKLFRAPEFADLDGIKNLADALDEREELIRLLDATMAADGVTVLVGAEAGELGGGQLSLVGARIGGNTRNAGVIGVIGPTRMDYPKVVPLVTATARAMRGYLDRTREDGGSRSRSDDDDDEPKLG